MKLFIFFIFIFLLISNVSAFDCSYFEDPEYCNELNEYNESLIADLIYTNTSFPNHNFIKEYNNKINVNSPPFDIVPKSGGNLNNVWFSFLTAQPSVIYQDNITVPTMFTLRSEYDYSYSVPPTYYNNKKRIGKTCKIKYYLYSHSGTLKIYGNGQYLTDKKKSVLSINEPTEFRGVFTAKVKIKEKHYEWRKRNHHWYCKYDYTSYDKDTINVEDTIYLIPYNALDEPNFTFIYEYNDNYQGIKSNQENNINIIFNNSYYKESFYEYNAIFSKDPYYFLTIKAKNISSKESSNLNFYNNSILVKDKENCNIFYSDFFETKQKQCEEDFQELELEQFERQEFSQSWNLLFYSLAFIFIFSLIYFAIKKSWGKILVPFVFIILFLPSVHADECGLSNLASCIPEKMYDFIVSLLNAPLQPLLTLTRSLLENPPSIDIFQNVWIILVYCVSFFYGFLFMYAGFQFLISGHDVAKREMAKEWLKNTVFMITLIQGSFYLYGLILELGSILTSSVLSLVDEYFFMLTMDNISNMGLEFLFLSFYVITLFVTILFLLIRYLIVSFGIIYVPVALFCYFVPPLRSYGKLLLHILGSFIFVTFLDAIIILGCSMLIGIPLFSNIKILIMIACFSIINGLFFILLIKTTLKALSSSGISGGDVAQAVKYVAMVV